MVAPRAKLAGSGQVRKPSAARRGGLWVRAPNTVHFKMVLLPKRDDLAFFLIKKSESFQYTVQVPVAIVAFTLLREIVDLLVVFS